MTNVQFCPLMSQVLVSIELQDKNKGKIVKFTDNFETSEELK